MKKRSPEAAEIFCQGANFLAAAEALHRTANYGPLYITCTVNAAFAAEILLKACLHRELGLLVREHKLETLFGMLSTDTQSSVLRLVSARQDCTESECRVMLAADSKTFELWRYHYEYDALGTRPAFLINFARSIEAYLIEEDPEWIKLVPYRLEGPHAASNPYVLPYRREG